jgi:hypothetical protein
MSITKYLLEGESMATDKPTDAATHRVDLSGASEADLTAIQHDIVQRLAINATNRALGGAAADGYDSHSSSHSKNGGGGKLPPQDI